MSLVEVVWDAHEAVLGEQEVVRAVELALRWGGREGIGIAVVFVSDDQLAALHAEHLGDPSPTDVMAFDLGEDGGGPAGELYVSVDRAREVARRRGVAFARELTLYVVHGVLHLCGFDDRAEADRTRMRRAEAEVLAALGHAHDDGPHHLED